MALSKQDREEIVEIIKLTVNGKVDNLSDRMDEHIRLTQPYVQAGAGLRIIYKVIIAAAALFVALDQIMDYGIIKDLFASLKP